MLLHSIQSGQAVERTLDIIVDRSLVKFRIVLAVESLYGLQLLYKRSPHVGSQIEVKCRNGLSAVHLVLRRLKRYASDDTGSLDAFCRTRLAVAGSKSVFEYTVKRMLHACKALRRIVVFVMDMQIAVAHSLARFVRQQIVVDKRLSGLAREFHHHSRRRIGVHIRILAGDVIVLGLDDFKEHVACLGTAGYASLVAVGYITFRNLLPGALHQLHLHTVLNLLHSHAFRTGHADSVGNLMYQSLIFAHLRLKHGLADGRLYLFVIIAHDAPVALNYSLYHREFYLIIFTCAKLRILSNIDNYFYSKVIYNFYFGQLLAHSKISSPYQSDN